MLLTTLYHRIDHERQKYSNSFELFKKHLEFARDNYHVVLPGDTLSKARLNVCLSFDDGYEEMYTKVYPLLRELELKALLAVSPKMVGSEGYCGFDELCKMGDVFKIASHGLNHINLAEGGIDLDTEVVASKRILEEMVGGVIDCFVFPFGRYNKESLRRAKEHYEYVFRIGNAINPDFGGIDGVIYRINCDNLKSYDEPFKRKNILKYYAKGLLKRCIR